MQLLFPALLRYVRAVPGSFSGPAGRAYPYYTPEARAWQAPLRIQIQPAQ